MGCLLWFMFIFVSFFGVGLVITQSIDPKYSQQTRPELSCECKWDVISSKVSYVESLVNALEIQVFDAQFLTTAPSYAVSLVMSDFKSPFENDLQDISKFHNTSSVYESWPNFKNSHLCQLGKLQHYRQVSNIRHTLVGNKTVDHSDVVGASPVGPAPTTSSFST